MSNGTKKIIISSLRDDEEARMLVISLLREPVFMQDVYQLDQVMKLSRISKPRSYEFTDVKQCGLLLTRNYGPGKRGAMTWAVDAGCLNEAAKDRSNESTEAVVADVTILDAAESSPSEQGPCLRECLLADASTDAVKNVVRELYRLNAAVGDGGTADAIRKQIATDELIGGRDHIRKGRERVRQIERILSKNPNHPDKDLLERLRNDLIDALGAYSLR